MSKSNRKLLVWLEPCQIPLHVWTWDRHNQLSTIAYAPENLTHLHNCHIPNISNSCYPHWHPWPQCLSFFETEAPYYKTWCIYSTYLTHYKLTTWGRVLENLRFPHLIKKIPYNLWYLKLHHVHKRPPLVSSLTQMNPTHALPTYIFKIHFNTVISCRPKFSKWSLFFKLPHRSLESISLLHHVCHMSHPSHSPWSEHLNTWQSIYDEGGITWLLHKHVQSQILHHLKI